MEAGDAGTGEAETSAPRTTRARSSPWTITWLVGSVVLVCASYPVAAATRFDPPELPHAPAVDASPAASTVLWLAIWLVAAWSLGLLLIWAVVHRRDLGGCSMTVVCVVATPLLLVSGFGAWTVTHPECGSPYRELIAVPKGATVVDEWVEPFDRGPGMTRTLELRDPHRTRAQLLAATEQAEERYGWAFEAPSPGDQDEGWFGAGYERVGWWVDVVRANEGDHVLVSLTHLPSAGAQDTWC